MTYKHFHQYKKNIHKFEKLSETDQIVLSVFGKSIPLTAFELDEIISNSIDDIHLASQKYVLVDEKYFHPLIKPESDEDARMLFKLALYEKYFEEGLDGCRLAKLIFIKDKHAKFRGKQNNTYDRLDTYRVDFEHIKKYDRYTMRHHGTKEGGDIRQSVIKQENLPYGLFLQNGPGSNVTELISHFTHKPIEGLLLWNPETDKDEYIVPAEYHHAKYNNKKSANKTREPSQLLGLKFYKKFTQAEHLEMLGCIILSTSEHSAVHSIKYGSIALWKIWAERFGYTVPFHWRSEENYIISITHLENITEGEFLVNKAPSYDEFINQNN